MHILVVDDEADIRETLCRHMRLLGHVTRGAENGRAALAVLEEWPVELVITDINMPEMDGLELMRHLRYDWPLIRAIVITGQVTQENVLACMRYGAETCLFKPLNDADAMEAAVRQAEANIARWKRICYEAKRLA